jgi:RNA polymerase sigma factor (sigma-70 family)
MPSPSTVLLRTQSDERLVALVQAGHERAFEAIVERYRKPLLRACLRILPEARAEDALQQALVAAWNALKRGDDVHELRAWLYRIARNTALNQLRMAGYDLEELVETLSATHDPEEEVLRRAVVRQTLAAVAALPERQREALLRTAVEGRGQDEVARDLGLSDTAVRALVHRARVRVRAAATALVPLPLASWAAGAGGAGAAATLAKAGTLAVLAGGAVTAPALMHDQAARHHAAQAHQAKTHQRSEARAAPTARALLVASLPVRHAGASEPAGHADHRDAAARHRNGGDGSERSGHGGGDDASDRVRHDDQSGHGGSGGDGSSGSDDSGSGGGSDDGGHSGPGGGGGDDGGGDAQPVTQPVATATPVVEADTETDTEDHSSGGDSHGRGGDDSSGSGSGSGDIGD